MSRIYVMFESDDGSRHRVEQLRWKEFQRVMGPRKIVGVPMYFSFSPTGKLMFYPGLPNLHKD